MIQKCTKVQQQQHLHRPFYPTRRLHHQQQQRVVRMETMMAPRHVYTLTIILWISMTMVFKCASRKSLTKTIGKGLGPRQWGGDCVYV